MQALPCIPWMPSGARSAWAEAPARSGGAISTQCAKRICGDVVREPEQRRSRATAQAAHEPETCPTGMEVKAGFPKGAGALGRPCGGRSPRRRARGGIGRGRRVPVARGPPWDADGLYATASAVPNLLT